MDKSSRGRRKKVEKESRRNRKLSSRKREKESRKRSRKNKMSFGSSKKRTHKMASEIPKYKLADILYSLDVATESGKPSAVNSFKRLNIDKIGNKKLDRVSLKDLRDIIVQALIALDETKTLKEAENAAIQLKKKHPLSSDLITQLINIPFEQLRKLQNLNIRGPKGVRYTLVENL